MDNFRQLVLRDTGIILGSFLVFGVIAYLLLGSIDSQSHKIAADRELASGRSYALDNLSSIKQGMPEADSFSAKFDALLPHEDGLVGFQQFAEDLGRVHNLDLNFSYNGQSVEPTAKDPGYVSFNMSVTGAPDDIRDFINEAEAKTTKYLITLDGINYTASGGLYRADFGGKVYFK